MFLYYLIITFCIISTIMNKENIYLKYGSSDVKSEIRD